MSPALAGGFLTTAPPGKPLRWLLNDALSNLTFLLRGVYVKSVHVYFSFAPIDVIGIHLFTLHLFRWMM